MTHAKHPLATNQATKTTGADNRQQYPDPCPKAVLINEDTVHAADDNGNGDAGMAQNRPVKAKE